MSDINREFEQELLVKSLSFGVIKGNSITTDYTIEDADAKINQSKGVTSDAILGRIIKRASTT